MHETAGRWELNSDGNRDLAKHPYFFKRVLGIKGETYVAMTPKRRTDREAAPERPPCSGVDLG
jgi:hypothetical protein